MRYRRRYLNALCFAALAACDNVSTRLGGAEGGLDAGPMGPPDSGVDGGDVDSGGVLDSGGEPTGIVLSELSAPVRVDFDRQGVLHVRCERTRDCFVVQGYYHAAHRFGQMDARRRVAQGTVSEVLSGAALDQDRELRRFLATREGEPIEDAMFEAMDDETLEMFESYAAGIEAWIGDLRARRNGARLSPEWDFVGVPGVEGWGVQDSISCGLLLMQSLTNNSGPELAAGEAAAVMEPPQVFDLFGVRPSTDAVILNRALASSSRGGVRVSALSIKNRLETTAGLVARVGAQLAPLGIHKRGRGSNSWVVAPQLASSRAVLLANDPHLEFGNPAFWYLVTLASTEGDVHVGGMSFPGIPGVFIGQNRNLAWGMTNSFFDMADVYVEELSADGEGVLLNGEVVPFVAREHTFQVRGEAPVTETFLYVPHHGPVVGMDAERRTALTIRWTGQDASTDMNFFLAMMKAGSLEEARSAARNITSFGQSLVVGDREGRLGWFPYSRLPERPWASAERPSWLPVAGDGSAEWTSFVAYEDLPQVVDPPEGLLATSNGDMTGALQDGDPTNDGLPWSQGHAAEGYRQGRILDRLREEAGGHSVETMRQLQGDISSTLAEATLPILLSHVAGSTLAASASVVRVLEHLRAWRYDCPSGAWRGRGFRAPHGDDAALASARGCLVFHVLWGRLLERTFGDELASAGVRARPRQAVMSLLLARPETLAAGPVYWDDVSTTTVEGAAEIILRALEDTGEWLGARLGPDSAGWLWGRVHTLTRRPVLTALQGTAFDDGPYPAAGGLHTVNLADPVDLVGHEYDVAFGPATRFICEISRSGPRCSVQLPGGQRSWPGEAHYNDLLEGWFDNRPHPLAFTSGEVDASSVETQFLVAP